MRTITRSTRTLAAVSLTAALGLGLAACQDDVTVHQWHVVVGRTAVVVGPC